MFKKLGQGLILIYKKTLSKMLGASCMYTPTCSMYTFDAIEKYGLALGSIMGTRRILRCNPLAKGGFDPVKENFKGKAKWIL